MINLFVTQKSSWEGPTSPPWFLLTSILQDTYLHFPIILSFMYLFFVKELYINYGDETPNVTKTKTKTN
jgi:hypothetical protein